MQRKLRKLFVEEQKTAKQIGKIIGLTTNQVYGQLYRYGIRKNKPRLTQWFNNNLKNLTDEEIYLLGFLWADGYLNSKNTTTNNYHNLQCQITYDDYLDIELIFSKTGKWGKYIKEASRKKGVVRQKSVILTISDISLTGLLCSLDFDKKSHICPTKLLKKIPKNKFYLFYRGYSDGDGCFYITNKAKQFSISGTYEQNWSHIENLFRELAIKKYKIQKSISKLGHRSSKIRVSNLIDIKKIANYLYQDKLDIGLKRKRAKIDNYIDD